MGPGPRARPSIAYAEFELLYAGFGPPSIASERLTCCR